MNTTSSLEWRLLPHFAQPPYLVELVTCSCGKSTLMHLQSDGCWKAEDLQWRFTGMGWHCTEGHKQDRRSPSLEGELGRRLSAWWSDNPLVETTLLPFVHEQVKLKRKQAMALALGQDLSELLPGDKPRQSVENVPIVSIVSLHPILGQYTANCDRDRATIDYVLRLLDEIYGANGAHQSSALPSPVAGR